MKTALPSSDTIFAAASGAGRTAVAVIRISGPGTVAILTSLLEGRLPSPRRASLRTLRDTVGEVLDRALVLWLPGPGTFTGEDQAELQIHGSAAVRAACLRALSDLPGCRAAEPGEFTRRAYLNGKLDLSAVEGLADLIDAETEAQRRQAQRQLDGHLADAVEAWRRRLLEALAACEAALDFADEDDVPSDVASGAASAAASVLAELHRALAGAARGERLRDGLHVVIAGAPNAGKSTLLNALARRDVAIVSPIPGTTRDAIEIRCDLDGQPVIFIDTAGLRESADPVEREGVDRAKRRMEQADLILWLHPPDGVAPGSRPIEDGPTEADTPRLVVATKADIGRSPSPTDVAVSALTGEGMEELLRLISREASRLMGGSDALLTRERHRRVLTDVAACLDRAAVAGQNAPLELLAEDLRLALRHLGRITGAVDVEDVLDRIFAAFCIGK